MRVNKEPVLLVLWVKGNSKKAMKTIADQEISTPELEKLKELNLKRNLVWKDLLDFLET